MTRPGAIVRSATPDDYPSIAALLDRTFEARPIEQRMKLWEWRYDRNPARTDSFPPFLVAEQEGRIVGAHGLTPLRVKAGREHLLASCSCDLAVDPAARSAGMKLKLKALGREVSPLHISTSANEPANRITLALGGSEVPSARRKYLKPLKISGLIRKWKNRGNALAGIAAVAEPVISKPIDWGLSVGLAVGPRKFVKGAAIRDLARFDARFDGFWLRLAEEHAISVVRDSAYLNWRYSDYPFEGIQSFELSRGEELLGFAVIHVADDEDRLRFAAVLELAVPKRETDVLDHLLGEAVRRAGEAGAHYVIARASAYRWEELYRRRGFRPRDLPFSPVTYRNNSDVPDDLFAQDRNWYLSLGDGDGCFYFEAGS